MTVYDATAEEIGLQLGDMARHRKPGGNASLDATGCALMQDMVEAEVLTDEDMLAALSLASGLLKGLPKIIEAADPSNSYGLYISMACINQVIGNLEFFTGTARETYTGEVSTEH